MNTSPPRVLIAENQYLIAMEVERILHENLACDVKITPVAGLSEEITAERYDVVIVEAALVDTLNAERAALILAAGAVPIFFSSYDHFPDAGMIVSAYPIISKPPQPDELTSAVSDAIRGKAIRPQKPS
jgi:two-component SAPR family response regulator